MQKVEYNIFFNQIGKIIFGILRDVRIIPSLFPYLRANDKIAPGPYAGGVMGAHPPFQISPGQFLNFSL